MNGITLQDIITKRLGMTTTAPDDLVCDAYYKLTESAKSLDFAERVDAYIDALVALEANKQCGIAVPNLERMAGDLFADSNVTTKDIVDFYLKNEQ